MEPQLQKHVSNDRNNEVWTLIALSIVYYYRAHTKTRPIKKNFSLFCCYRTPNARWCSNEAQ